MGSNDETVSGEVTKRLEPTRAIGLECVPFKERRVKSVCVIYKLLKVFQGNLGQEGRAPKVLEKAIKTVSPETDDDVVLVGYIAKRSGICVIYKLLNVFQGNLGREGRAPKVLEKAIKTVGPETDDDVVLVGYIAKRSWNARCQRNLQKIEHHFR